MGWRSFLGLAEQITTRKPVIELSEEINYYEQKISKTYSPIKSKLFSNTLDLLLRLNPLLFHFKKKSFIEVRKDVTLITKSWLKVKSSVISIISSLNKKESEGTITLEERKIRNELTIIDAYNLKIKNLVQSIAVEELSEISIIDFITESVDFSRKIRELLEKI
ncbi:hypothetical protein HYV79_05250 [Candidatus Woesearchaeota archaeon]|nr:hypothetical protein [Candidatus Woesearchaeota archaeon]